MTTTIAITIEVREELEALKVHPRESFNDVLSRVLKKLKENGE